jgi:hypothetical protein
MSAADKKVADFDRLEGDREGLLESLLHATLLLQAFEEERTNFWARAAHDLRAPLTAASGYCELLAEAQMGPLNANQQELLSRMQHSLRKLSRMASAMFQLTAGRQLERKYELKRADIEGSIQRMHATLERMTEWCDPYVYYHRVRPYIHGWKNHPDLPDGLLYEGVDAYAGLPQLFRGETGAQSAIVPSLDALLGIGHKADSLRTYLQEMRTYMPPAHRAFIESIEARGSVRPLVQQAGRSKLTELYDACVSGVERFRSLHLEYAASYIFRQAQTDAKNPHAVGTGGTPFMQYLKKHRDETAEHRLK